MNDKEQFIANLWPVATKISQETGMSRELALAQAAQETGWGEKILPGTNNIFNIKASPGWHGPTKTFTVSEFKHGKKVMVNAEFRVYDSLGESLLDRIKFLQENSRYARAGLFDPNTKGNLEKEAAALQKAGYATDPKYAGQLIAVYNSPTMQRAIKHAQEQSPASALDHVPTLSVGQASVAVHTLQADLNKLGYKDAHGHPLKADGDFGPDTKRAVEKFQGDHGLSRDGKAGHDTQAALYAALQAGAVPDLTDPKNPDHALYQQTLAGVHKLDTGMGRTPDKHSINLAASLTVAAKIQGLTHIDAVVLSEDGSRTFAVQHTSSLAKLADVATARAVHTPLEKSSLAAQAVTMPTLDRAMPLSVPSSQHAPWHGGPAL